MCVDTRDISNLVVQGINAYNSKHFEEAVDDGDFEAAALWQANAGRSLSLGDFAAVDLARTDLPEDLGQVDYLAMAQAVRARYDELQSQSLDLNQTLLTCSGPEDEVALVWSLPARS